jgi:hypothetical protein
VKTIVQIVISLVLGISLTASRGRADRQATQMTLVKASENQSPNKTNPVSELSPSTQVEGVSELPASGDKKLGGIAG